jgi:hypothetical protein
VPIQYLTLEVADRVGISDSASAVKIEVLSVLDVIAVADYASVRSIAVHTHDYEIVADSASVATIKTISVADYIIYDYVPHVPPSDIRYRSLYTNVGIRTISVFDRIAPYESIWVGPRVITVHARDYLVSDSATAVRISVHAYDILMRDNANIVRIT